MPASRVLTTCAGTLPPPPASVFALLADTPGSLWFDGGESTAADDTFSVIVWSPTDVVRDVGPNLTHARALSRFHKTSSKLPFLSGVAGYLGYGAGRHTSPVPAQASAWEPESWLGRYEGALVYHHASATWFATGSEALQREAEALFHAAPTLPPPRPAPSATTTSSSRSAWEARVRRILDWILDGDCYQVDLTRAIHAHVGLHPLDTYRRMRALSSPDRAAMLVLEDGLRILCNSPERLLDLREHTATTTPIKGTMPRGDNPQQDALYAAQLKRSAKDIAELVMITDLCRNDLGRIALAGGVCTEPRQIVPYANVWHAQQPVHATLRPDLCAWDVLCAMLPIGSVVGAPKIRAAKRIAMLEPEPRGVYCGAIGFVSDHGSATFNVAIRTAVLTPDRARWHVGAGIVADSDPRREWEETIAKGSVLSQALIGGPETHSP